ncbi:MAG TPA: folate hydrolase, partial [Chitinophagaceae bacterium]
MRKIIVTAFIGVLTMPVFSQSKPLLGFGEPSSAAETAAEKKFDSYLSAANADQYVKEMSARPHHVGSPGGKAVAEYILNHFKSWGYDASIETFYVLFPTPKERLLEMTGPVNYKAVLAEQP